MECCLITRSPNAGPDGNPTTQDLTLDISLARDGKRSRETIQTLPASEWSTLSTSQLNSAQTPDIGRSDPTFKQHALAGWSALGSGESDEFATFAQGRTAWEDSAEGFLLTASLSTGFSGLTTAFVEHVRDEFPKTILWTTGMLENARGWKRTDTERAKAQRMLNEALALITLEDLSTMVLPIQPVRPWSMPDGAKEGELRILPGQEWRKYVRDDVDPATAYETLRTIHLQSAGTELREVDALSTITEQLNWRGGNKVASLSGMTPILPRSYWSPSDTDVARELKRATKDYSAYEDEESAEEERRRTGRKRRDDEVPYGQYGLVRGFDFEDSQAMGPLLEQSALPLRDPISRWVSLPDPYPLDPSRTAPIFRGLHPATGHPLVLPSAPSLPLISSAAQPANAALFGLADPRYPTAMSFVAQQPRSIPTLTTLSTTPRARDWFKHLSRGIGELRRVRAGVLGEYEVALGGREGIDECRERLDALWDEYGGGTADEEDEAAAQAAKDEDENWDGTEQQEDWDL
ncbi:hypothetical protein BMF94_4370 [Rhodotorula taiwanensis]|uniref:DML1/Misato tubulin domain-containing protein n=1 Tax=Rhodotorula taiwanensis TaxID=741276 RepID=A0A2S5B6Y3_9BASI|nr:hypothetical protein BMF94_4370 [Rhodotorula taiwanensis]